MTASVNAKPGECLECGKPTACKAQQFCTGPACRSLWHNRRKARGAEAYDVLMELGATPSSDGKRRGELLAHLGKLARAYRDSDRALRAGRKSWDYRSALERLPLAYGQEGDGR